MKTLEETELRMRQREIGERAFRMWKRGGKCHHRDMECWLEAEARLGAALPSRRNGNFSPERDAEASLIEYIEDVVAPAW